MMVAMDHSFLIKMPELARRLYKRTSDLVRLSGGPSHEASRPSKAHPRKFPSRVEPH